MTLRDRQLSRLDKSRSIAAKLGLREYRVFALDISNTHPEAALGYGTNATTETELTVNGFSPKVVQVSQDEILASGGLYQAQDLKVGPLTPGIIDPADFDPALAAGRTRGFRVEGPGLPANSRFILIGQDHSSALHFTLILRKV